MCSYLCPQSLCVRVYRDVWVTFGKKLNVFKQQNRQEKRKSLSSACPRDKNVLETWEKCFGRGRQVTTDAAGGKQVRMRHHGPTMPGTFAKLYIGLSTQWHPIIREVNFMDGKSCPCLKQGSTLPLTMPSYPWVWIVYTLCISKCG